MNYYEIQVNTNEKNYKINAPQGNSKNKYSWILAVLEVHQPDFGGK
jgi:hypothetical protein